MSEYTESQLRYQRSKGVNLAWKREQDLVRQGRGTRQWTTSEQKQILDKGRADHYQGHHMLSVQKYPHHAGNPNNIQFLSSKKSNNEHLAAHKGDYHTPSEWRYNVNTGKTRPLNTEKPRAMNSYELRDKAIEQKGYKHYAAKQNSNTVKNDSPAHKYSYGKTTAKQAKTTENKSPAKQYAFGCNSDGIQRYSRTMVKPSNTRSKSSSATKSQAKSSGQSR